MSEFAKRARRRFDGFRAADRSTPATVSESAGAESDLSREVRPGLLATEGPVVSKMLFDRLEASDIGEIERRIEESGKFQDQPWRGPDPGHRRFLLLTLGLWLEVPEVSAKTGLPAGNPPDEVHAMSRGPFAAGGGLYEADMVVSALLSVGVDVNELRRGLDFGCSSGRVARVLAAAYPGVDWHACDPNSPAIDWAQANLPGIEFFVNGNEPPLPLGDGELDLVYAISIWSHFEPQLGLRWFDEMHRVLAPGGHLVLTTHGLTSIDILQATGARSPEQALEIERALYSSGAWYAAEFGAQGDWGVITPSWGTAFLSPEWVLINLCPRWRVLEFATGRNAGNQDVYVLQRA